jgi:SUMO ligase MMS21 Smc5/6 complex component
MGIKEVEQLKRRLIQEKCVHEYEWDRVEVGEDMESVCVCKFCGHHC